VEYEELPTQRKGLRVRWMEWQDWKKGLRVRTSTVERDGRRIVTQMHFLLDDLVAEDIREAPLGRIIALAQGAKPPAKSLPQGDIIKRPIPGGENDSFYRQFADRYRQVVTETHAPAPVLAEEYDARPDTVRRWVHTARNKGFLPPGRKGIAG
jgi:hypothetical protein